MRNQLEITRHAAERLSQRGFTMGDLDLIQFMGTDVEGGLLVTKRDFQEFDRKLRRLRDAAQRLI